MTAWQRFKAITAALLNIFAAGFLITFGEEGYILVILAISISMILYALRTLVYYFTMARHMVGGLSILFRGVILLDLGLFTLSISRNYSLFIVLWLLIARALPGVIGILRALEAKRYGASSWRLSLAAGLTDLTFVTAALVFGFITKSLQILTWIYAAGVIYSSVLRIVRACRKTAIVYIQ